MMRKADAALFVGALLLAACGRPAPDADDKAVDTANRLEVAARERGIVHSEAPAPTGVFERSHDLGRDAMCVVSDGAEQWRFALAAAYGPGLSCRAHGKMVRDGVNWRLRFTGAPGCEAVVHEEEDELRLPGSLPEACASVCPQHASLAGLRLPRASWSETDARGLQIRDGQGIITRPCGS